MSSPDIRPSEGHASPRRGHEKRDVKPVAIALAALGLLLALLVLQPLLVWFFDDLKAAADKASPSRSPLAIQQQPPPPLLQAQPEIDVGALRRREDELLETYGWVDRQQRIVRIPIDRAMQLIAERGLPPTGPQQPPRQADKPPAEPSAPAISPTPRREEPR
jgi:hypothetical protein